MRPLIHTLLIATCIVAWANPSSIDTVLFEGPQALEIRILNNAGAVINTYDVSLLNGESIDDIDFVSLGIKTNDEIEIYAGDVLIVPRTNLASLTSGGSSRRDGPMEDEDTPELTIGIAGQDLRIDSDVGIGVDDPSYRLHVAGNAYASGNFFGNYNIDDTRSSNEAPNTYDNEVSYDFKSRSAIGVPGSGTYSGSITIAPWGDDSGDNHHQLNFNNGGIFWRRGAPNSTSWYSWYEVWTEQTDGSGSGLDADLLDGHHASYFATSSGALSGSGSSNYIAKWTGGSSLGNSTIYDNGIVGIGTTAPSVKLTVAGGHSDTKLRLYSTGNGSDQPSNLSLWASEPGVTYYGTGIGYNVNGHPNYGRIDAARGSAYIRFLPGETKFEFENSSGTSVSNVMVVQDNGNVGIGTASPSAKLDVVGSVQLDGLSSSTQSTILTVDGSGNVYTRAAGSWTGGGDNLGNHSATTDLDMNSNDIIDVGYISTGSSVATYPRFWVGPSWMELETNTSYPFLQISNGESTSPTYIRTEGGYTYINQGSYSASNYFIRGDSGGNVVIRGSLNMNSSQITSLDCDGGSTDAASCGWVRSNAEVAVSNTGSVVAGNWYRIASNSGNRADATFTLTDQISGGGHSTLRFNAGINYGDDAGMSVTLLSHSRYNTSTFTQARIINNSTYDGAYLEVYCNRSGSVSYTMTSNYQSSGWSAVDWSVGSVPSGWTARTYSIDKLFMVGDYDDRFWIDRGGQTNCGSTLDMNNNQIVSLYCDGGSTDAATCGWVSSNFAGSGTDNWVNETGDVMTGNLTFNDNVEGIVFSGNNAGIYANGEDLYIHEPEASTVWAYFDDDVGLRLTGTPNLYANGIIYSSGTGNNYFAGNVGIGTSAPSAPFDVRKDGGIRVTNPGSSTNYMTLETPGTWSRIYSTNNFTIQSGGTITLNTNGATYIGGSATESDDLYICDQIYDWDNTTYNWDGSGTTRENVHYNYGTFYMGSSSGDGDDFYLCDRMYDWDNTTYYVDPSSYTSLNDVGWGESGIRTQTRNDAGSSGSGIRSGFFQTSAPSPSTSWPPGSSSWQHLLDIRHTNTGNNYAMQFAGSFFDQRLYFRKTDNSASTTWSQVPVAKTGSISAYTTATIYSDDVIDIQWNASYYQPQFRQKTGSTRWWDVTWNMQNGSGTQYRDGDDIYASNSTWYYFYQNGSLSTSLNLGSGSSYGSDGTYWLGCESNYSGTVYSAYKIELFRRGSAVTYTVTRIH